jgi:DMSO/TMAO reductase YedYZ molybdopterin-dependent catalytic subunit
MRIWIALAAIAMLIAYGCIGQSGPIRLNGTEIREYKGEKLGSVGDFRENSIKGPQYIDASSYRLRISGLVENPKEYTYGQVVGFQPYQKVVTLNCVEGWSVNTLWQGVLVRDLLAEAKPKAGANTVIFHAYDGYSSAFPLGYFYGKDILMAYQLNNVTLPPERGFPFQLVAEDRWGYKWVKWIIGIELTNDSSYEGYWESRGYSDTGYLNQSFMK